MTTTTEHDIHDITCGKCGCRLGEARVPKGRPAPSRASLGDPVCEACTPSLSELSAIAAKIRLPR